MIPDSPPLVAVPTELSDEAAAELLEWLYDLTRMFENIYAAQIRRYHQGHNDRQTILPFDQNPPF